MSLLADKGTEFNAILAVVQACKNQGDLIISEQTAKIMLEQFRELTQSLKELKRMSDYELNQKIDYTCSKVLSRAIRAKWEELKC
jgi:hypothetical protein